jgi:hypothetical protein
MKIHITTCINFLFPFGMFNCLIITIFSLFLSILSAQNVAINSTGDTAHPSALLDLQSTNKGFLPPRMTQAQRDAIASPEVGLVIFNKTSNCLNYYLVGGWRELCGTLPAAVISGLNCGTAVNSGALTQNITASGVSSTISYTGGNAGVYNSQTINSTGVLGLTATLASGTLVNGSGTVTFTISGTPTSSGTASFSITLGGQTCTLTRVVFSPVQATGGTVSDYVANGTNGTNGVTYRVHSFTTTGSSVFQVTNAGSTGQVDYLIVAGGGGGGLQAGGGGGAGGLLTGSTVVNVASYTITVGSGGAGGNLSANGLNGSPSQAFGLSAVGGGGGQSMSLSSPSTGGSGGGGQRNLGTGNALGTARGLGTSPQGNNGGFGRDGGGDTSAGGGGGGAGQAGADATSNGSQAFGGLGGNGVQSSITGTATFYAGGGGGGNGSGGSATTSGGLGGGGTGQRGLTVGGNATANTGGGGGGGGAIPGDGRGGGNGGSGVVIIRYPLTNPNP